MDSFNTNYTDRKTLAYIGLTSVQATKCTTLSNYLDNWLLKIY